MEKKTIILPKLRYKQAPSEDLQTKVGLDSSQELLREGDRNIILDIETLFSKERNEVREGGRYGSGSACR